MKRWLAAIPLVLLIGFAVLGASRLYFGSEHEGVTGAGSASPGL